MIVPPICRPRVPILAALALFAAPAWAQAPSREQVLDRGRQLYVRNCEVCHGIVLEGLDAPGSAPSKMIMAVPALDEAGTASRLTDAQLYTIVSRSEHALTRRQSGWKMPSLRYSMKKGEIWTVLTYVKSTWSEEQRARQAEITARASDGQAGK
jgi:mono/diheme cytochrome c family protein